MLNKYIIVNGTALDKSGALTILIQFIDNIPDEKYNWLIFIPEKVCLSSKKNNVRLEPISGVKPMHKRLWWDAFGLKKWLRSHNIEPLASISLQNTGFSVGYRTPSFIYFHQPLPFYQNKWNPFKKQERLFWFYKNIYPLFVKLYLRKDTRIFVQLDYIKKGFTKRFKHSQDFIGIYSPSVTPPPNSNSERLNSEKKTFFYPATPFFYKNHRIILDALKYTDINADFYFTTHDEDIPSEDNRIKNLGSLTYAKVCDMYNGCDALLFPSYIETFGLPLLEAAMTGMPIIAADLPYSREVLDGYEGVTYVKYDDPLAWAKAMQDIKKGMRFNPIDISARKGWSDLFNCIISNIN